eukprot:12622885-Alexandrium_andersonii.AAC.1
MFTIAFCDGLSLAAITAPSGTTRPQAAGVAKLVPPPRPCQSKFPKFPRIDPEMAERSTLNPKQHS